jgi:hypothetical protein
MAIEYAKVLKFLNYDFVAIGRGEINNTKYESQTGLKCVKIGLTDYLGTKPALPNKVINSVGIDALYSTTTELLEYGVKDILLEKPGGAYTSEILQLAEDAKIQDAKVLIAYNRRFYSTVLKAEELILEDGGVSSFNFEFTEWSHVIKTLPNKTNAELHNWFLGNSTHVIDTAFYLCGKPKELSAFHKGSIEWHPSSSIFCGAGITDNDSLFSYHADWEAPGRWVLEIMTKKRRLIFKPMESLQVQVLGSVAVNPVEIDNTLDVDYKPGLYLQTKAFLENNFSRFCSINEQSFMISNVYKKMAGYS